jgi:HD-GYP domain-containing protein (c-di-GMP phosphodiesterase class II)
MSPRLPLAAAGILAGVAYVAREQRLRRSIERLGAATLETLLNAIEANDPVTGDHVRRVAAYALVIADEMGLPKRRQAGIERVALFHDIGKIYEALFDIVHDDAKLTAAERRAIATHPERGAQVLAPLAAFYPELPEGTRCHHERWDGTGYPRGLKGKRIPLEARIVSVVDTFDAVSHTRRYRRGGGYARALEVLAEGRGTQFDPEIVDLALLPPVAARLIRTRVGARPGPGRRRGALEPVPDVSFRWRTQSLAAG